MHELASWRSYLLAMPRTNAAELVAEAKGRLENLTPEQVATERHAARFITRSTRHGGSYADPTSAYHRRESDPARRTILYRASGGRSALAVEMLPRLGNCRVAHLDGNLKAWIAGGQPVTRE